MAKTKKKTKMGYHRLQISVTNSQFKQLEREGEKIGMPRATTMARQVLINYLLELNANK